ncbi:unnamed protein product [Somion occarium]|uniref:Uncharacterized protein n=1 Tax=Somion occarium TaxID=3059160 RepID=A0ABP1D0V7_9APHY
MLFPCVLPAKFLRDQCDICVPTEGLVLRDIKAGVDVASVQVLCPPFTLELFTFGSKIDSSAKQSPSVISDHNFLT